MTIALDHSCQSGRHTNQERGLDLYETPPAAVEALLRAETLPLCVWEPAAGRGAIVRVLRAHGHTVVASDVFDYGFPLDFISDFLTTALPPKGCGAILTNPPFQIITKFTRHALDLVPRVYLLCRLAFLETQGRTDILERRGLARIHVFRERLPMMHRDGWTGKKASSAIAFAWFVWDRGHRGPAILSRISARRADARDSAQPELRFGDGCEQRERSAAGAACLAVAAPKQSNPTKKGSTS
jgi:hypothetical protein